MKNQWSPRLIVRRLAVLVLLSGLAGGWGWAAGAGVDVQIIVLSTGKGPERVSITYAGAVAREQAEQDVQALSTALGRQAGDVRITTKRIADAAPEMTSVEATYPEIVKRAEGELPVQPFVDTYRRFGHLRLTFFLEGQFTLVSPAKPIESGDVRMAVDNQGPLVNYDVWITQRDGAAARVPALDGSGSWRRFLGPGLLLVVLIAAGIGVAVVVLVRRGGRASTG